MPSRSMVFGLVAAAGLAGAALAQIAPPPTNPAPAQPAPQPPAPAPTPTPATPAPTPIPGAPARPGDKTDPMSGPKVAPAFGQPTLIHQDMKGAIIRPEVPPDEAALDLVGLDVTERAAVDKVLAERAAILDKIVSENIPLILKFQGIRTGDSPKEQLQALKELFKVMQPLKEKGRLRDQVTAVISPEKSVRYTQIVEDYWKAIMQEGEETLKVRGEPPKPGAVLGRETLLNLGQEVRRSYDRQIAAKTGELNDLLVKIKATPEQETKIKALAADFFQQTLGKPTPQQRLDLFSKINKELMDDQREALMRELYSRK